jgi:hypothetical protein
MIDVIGTKKAFFPAHTKTLGNWFECGKAHVLFTTLPFPSDGNAQHAHEKPFPSLGGEGGSPLALLPDGARWGAAFCLSWG